MKKRQGKLRTAVHLLCMLALFAVGFGHKTPTLASQLSPAELSAYALPDGTLPDLCLTGKDGKPRGDHDRGNGCEACRIGSSIVLPQPADSLGLPIRLATETLLPRRTEAVHRQLFPPNASPRGPPAVRIV